MDFNYNALAYQEPRLEPPSPLEPTLVKPDVSDSITFPSSVFEAPPFTAALERFRRTTDLSVFTDDPLEGTRDLTSGRPVEL